MTGDAEGDAPSQEQGRASCSRKGAPRVVDLTAVNQTGPASKGRSQSTAEQTGDKGYDTEKKQLRVLFVQGVHRRSARILTAPKPLRTFRRPARAVFYSKAPPSRYDGA